MDGTLDLVLSSLTHTNAIHTIAVAPKGCQKFPPEPLPVGSGGQGLGRVFLCDESKNYARKSELGTGLRRGRVVNRALIRLIRANLAH